VLDRNFVVQVQERVVICFGRVKYGIQNRKVGGVILVSVGDDKHEGKWMNCSA